MSCDELNIAKFHTKNPFSQFSLLHKFSILAAIFSIDPIRDTRGH